MLEIFDKNLALEQDGDLINMMNRVRRGLEQYIPGDRIMTDDNAPPIELPGMKVMDDLSCPNLNITAAYISRAALPR